MFNLFGIAVAAREQPHFGIPVFTREDCDGFFAQKVGKDELIEEFIPISRDDVEEMGVKKELQYEGSLEVGSPAHYAFFLRESEGIFDDRPSVEAYVADNMEFISVFAIANLQALRFIGCSRLQELEALKKFSQIFKNEDVRKRFLMVESSLIRADEVDKNIEGLIDRLHSSHSFATTHDIISALHRHESDFKHRHFKTAMHACLNNNQVHWISGDDDVRNFIRFLIDKGKLRLTSRAKSKLEA